MLTRLFTQRVDDEIIQHTEIIGALFWSGQDQRQYLVVVLRIHQNAQQVEQLFCRADPARENNDAMGDTHKRFQTFFDVWHDDQLIHQRIRRFGRNDGGFCQADKAAVTIALLGVANGGPFHWCFHHARPAAGTDIQLAQTQLRTNIAAILVLNGVD